MTKSEPDETPPTKSEFSMGHDRARDHLERIEKLVERRIGEMLLEANLIRKEDLDRALRVKAEKGGDTARILVSLGCLSVDDFLTFLSALPGIHTFDLSQYEIPRELIRRVPKSLAETYEVIPIDREGGLLTLGVARALDDEDVQFLEQHVGMSIRPVLCLAEDIRAAIQRYYGDDEVPPEIREQDWDALAAPLRLSLVARLLREIDAFPALPETVVRVRKAMNEPNSSVRDVSDVIVMDPPVAAKVLSVANSAAYGFPRRVDDIALAVTLLGLRETYSIVLSVAVLNILEKSLHLDYKRFWLEALCCAAATRFVLKAGKQRNIPGVFVAALLHDIGRVALAEVLPQLVKRIDTGLQDNALVSAEERLVGISHPEAGYILAAHWGLPEEIASAIRFHHRPEQADNAREVVAVVVLADALARSTGRTLEESRGLLERHKASLEILGIDQEGGEAMIQDFISRRDDSLRDAMR